MLADPDLREALYCIRCGACLNICPVYQKVGGHAYGWVYPGPIGAIVSPTLVGLKNASDLPFASSLCGACKDACPVKINIPRMLLHQRHKLSESTDPSERAAGFLERLASTVFGYVLRHPKHLSFARSLIRSLERPFSKNGKIKQTRLPILSLWTQNRDLKVIAPKSFKDIWQTDLSKDHD